MLDVYFAGPQESWRSEIEGLNLLVTFKEKRQLKLIRAGWRIPKLLIDSGAFTVWQQQQKGKRISIDLDEYRRFLESIWDDPEVGENYAYFNLDKIPDDWSSDYLVAKAAEASFKNWEKLRADGFNPIPVYHYGEPAEFLDEYVLKDSPLIGLGPTLLRKKRIGITDWFLDIFDRWPKQRFHGLGVTNPLLISHLPFASVDSTTWIYVSKSGPRCVRWLLKQLPPSFKARWEIDDLDAWLDRVCETRDLKLYRRIGIDAIQSIPRCHPGKLPTPFTRLFLEKVEAEMVKGGYDGEMPLWGLVERLFEDGTLYDYDRFYNGFGLPPEYDPVNW